MGTFFLFIAIGFIAQIVDGALGMAYGIINMSILLSIGIPPAPASAAIHSAEIFTTGASGISHAIFKNIHKGLFLRLVFPGIIGSIIGAYLLTVLPTELMKPVIAIYLLLNGCYILYKSFEVKNWFQRLKDKLLYRKFRRREASLEKYSLMPVGFAGGFFDALGGGGWGAFTTTTLIAQGIPPRYTIGTVSLSEFLITIASSATFFFSIGIAHWVVILGLIIGGVIAAPFAAYMVKHLSTKLLMRIVGGAVILISIRILFLFFLSEATK